MWVRAGGVPERKVLLFDYAPSRSAEVGKRLLLDFKGILLTDVATQADARPELASVWARNFPG
jgi:hypothetical protein